MKTKIAVALAIASLASVASAQQGKAEAGPYVGLSGGRTNTAFVSQDFSTNAYVSKVNAGAVGRISDTTDAKNTAWRIFLGYKFDQNWALEGAYTSLGEAKYTLNGTAGTTYAASTAQFRVDQSAWSLAVKGTLPLSKEFDIFALLGATSNSSKLNVAATGTFANATNLRTTAYSTSKSRGYGMGGVGLEYKPTANVGIRAEYHNYGSFGSNFNNTVTTTGRTENDAWLLGVSVKF